MIALDPAFFLPLIPVVAFTLALIGWALVSIVRGPVQYLPKAVWALIVVLFVPLGAVVYLVVGRARGARLKDADLR